MWLRQKRLQLLGTTNASPTTITSQPLTLHRLRLKPE
jgi:hypothetical protein